MQEEGEKLRKRGNPWTFPLTLYPFPLFPRSPFFLFPFESIPRRYKFCGSGGLRIVWRCEKLLRHGQRVVVVDS
jgi:hypothetical protein